DLLRSDLEELSRQFVYGNRLARRRKGEDRAACGDRRLLGTVTLAGVETRGARARRLSADRHDPGIQRERIFVVLHVDRADAVLLSQSGVAAADGVAIPFLQRADWLRHSGRIHV